MGTSIGIGGLGSQTSLLQSQQDRMVQQMKSPQGPTDDAKIEKGAREFEAILVGSWLQQAYQSFATVPGADSDSQDVAHDQVMSFGVQSLATSMAASGGIGIGKMIAKAMHAAAAKTAGQSPATAESEK
jgi:Rod binding domain-containing protein